MPTYEYRCSRCGAEFETLQRMSDPPRATCPECGSADAQRLISHSTFVLKGSGWYVTDYARKDKNGRGNGSSPPGSSHDQSSSPEASGKSEGGEAASGDAGGKAESGESSSGDSKTPKSGDSGSATASG